VRVRSPLLFVAFAVCGCGGEQLSTPPADIGQPTASSEVVALAGPDLLVLEGSRVQLAGSGSRALLGAPTLRWSQREGPLVVLSSASSATPTFVAPLGPARLTFTLEVSADDTADRDDVTVFVVTDAADVAPPAVLTLPGDRVGQGGQDILVDTAWAGNGTPLVTARCRVGQPPTSRVQDGVLSLAVQPLELPCPIVVDDVVEDDGDVSTIETGAGRASFIVWPVATSLAPATQVPVPATASPSSEVAFEISADAVAFFVDGLPNTTARVGDQLSFVTPKSAGRVTILVEERLGGTSGGARVVPIEVGPGPNNSAPTVVLGDDLGVRPGSRFRIAPGVSDDDGDDTTVSIVQVLGAAARAAGGDLGVLIAPDVTGVETLLFHVSASDGVVDSPPQSVRVVIDPAAENQPPTLVLPPERFVQPGATFRLDASSAQDPDAGLIVAYGIAQDSDDDVIVLETPVETASVDLVAGAAGEVYRFVLSAVDAGGLEVSTPVRVTVEEAGPFVDAARGTPAGPGTAAAPFSSIDAAIATASRHGFASLLLARSDVPLSVGVLPDGLGLVGGSVFDAENNVYAESDGLSAVRLSGPTLRVAGGDLEGIRLSASGPATLELQRRVTLRQLVVDDQNPPTCVADVGSRVEILDSTLGTITSLGTLAITDSDVARLVLRGASTTISGRSEVGAASVAVAVDVERGLLVTAPTTRVTGSEVGVRAGVNAVVDLGGAVVGEGDGVRAVVVAGGTVAISGVINARGAGAVGVDVQSGVVGGSANVNVVGADGVGMRAAGSFGGAINGTVSVGGAGGVGVDVGDGAFARLRVTARGQQAVGVVGGRLALESCLIDVDGTGVDGEGGDDGDDELGRDAVAVEASEGTLVHVTLRSTGLGVQGQDDEAAAQRLRLENVLLLAPLGVAGAVDGGAVGFAIDAFDGFNAEDLPCTRCIEGTLAAVDDDGALVDDVTFGAPNPFVDVGDADVGVSLDLDGQSIPQGLGPDLGARERGTSPAP